MDLNFICSFLRQIQYSVMENTLIRLIIHEAMLYMVVLLPTPWEEVTLCLSCLQEHVFPADPLCPVP